MQIRVNEKSPSLAHAKVSLSGKPEVVKAYNSFKSTTLMQTVVMSAIAGK